MSRRRVERCINGAGYAANAYDRKFMPETAVEPTEFGKTHTFDKTKGYDIDPDFFGGILDFYNEYCGK